MLTMNDHLAAANEPDKSKTIQLCFTSFYRLGSQLLEHLLMAINHSFLNHFTTPVLAAFLRSQPMMSVQLEALCLAKMVHRFKPKTSGCNGRSKLKAVSQGFTIEENKLFTALSTKKVGGENIVSQFSNAKDAGCNKHRPSRKTLFSQNHITTSVLGAQTL